MNLLDKYLSGNMSPDEKLAFENELQNNTQLKMELKACQIGIENLKENEREVLKKRLQELELNLRKQKKERKAKLILLILLLAFTLLILLWWWNSYSINEINSSRDVPIVKMEDSIYIDSQLVNTVLEHPKQDSFSDLLKVSKLNNSILRYEELYALNFKTFTNDDIEFELRGLNEKSAFELYKYYYNNNKFDEVLLTYEKLTHDLKESDLVLLMQANAFMNKERYDSAIKDLNLLTKNGKSILSQDAFWYLALCYLKKGQVNKVKSILQNRFLNDKPMAKALFAKL